MKYNMSARKTYVANRDVVQTALHALGLEKGDYMTGRVLHEVFAKPKMPAVDKARRFVSGFQTLFIAVLLCAFYVL